MGLLAALLALITLCHSGGLSGSEQLAAAIKGGRHVKMKIAL